MSDNNLSQDVTDIDLETCHIGTLRSLASKAGVSIQRDWKRDDIVKAVRAARGESVEEVSSDPETIEDEAAIEALLFNRQTTTTKAPDKPKPGYARVLVHKDPTPGHNNSPIPVGLNGRMVFIPRGVPVDVQIEYVGVLKDAVHHIIRQTKEPTQANMAGEVVEEDVLSYPFQVIAVTPGKSWRNEVDQRAKSAAKKQQFAETFNHWPTKGELEEWEKSIIINKTRN